MKSAKAIGTVIGMLAAGVVMAPLGPLFSCFTQGTGPCINQIVTGAVNAPAPAATTPAPPSSATQPSNVQSGGN